MNATCTVTRTLAGHTITLTAGRRYLASRPMARRGKRTYPVMIADITFGLPVPGGRSEATRIIPSLSYDEANAFLSAFNNGKTSFEGRVWS